MSKPAAIFVAAAMAVTAGCVSVIASRGLSLGLPESILAGFLALAVMAVTHLAFLRASPKDDGRVDDIDRVVTELQSRLETAEARLAMLDGAGAERARAATRPLVEEIAALSGLVTTIAKEVAGHDVAIAKLKSGPAMEAQPVTAPQVQPQAPRAQAPQVQAPQVQAPPVHAAPGYAPQPPAPAYVETAPARQAPSRAAAPYRAEPPALQPVPEPFDLDDQGADAGGGEEIGRLFARALSENRIEPYLQPIVALPGRRATHYEALARLVERDGAMGAADFVKAAGERIAEVDRLTIERAAGVVERLSARGGGSVFVNLSPLTLSDQRVVGEIGAFLEQRKDIARMIVLEMRQADMAELSEASRRTLDGFVERGVKISLDDAQDIRFDPRALVRQGVRFIKVPAARLLDPEAARGVAIHPADLSGLLARHGVDLIATHVEEERTVPELLDMDVRLAQGFLFGMPRPVRPAAEGSAPERAVPAAAARLVPRAATR